MHATVVAQRGSRALVVSAVLIGTLLSIAFAGNLVSRSPATHERRVAIADIAEGPSLVRVGNDAVVFVRHGTEISAFAAAVPPGDAVVWCPAADQLRTVLYSSVFDLDGTKLGGPAPEDLLGYPTRVDRTDLVVDTGVRFDWPALPWTDALASQWVAGRGGVCPGTSR